MLGYPKKRRSLRYMRIYSVVKAVSCFVKVFYGCFIKIGSCTFMKSEVILIVIVLTTKYFLQELRILDIKF